MHFNLQESFYSTQGEGDHMGRAAYFVRLMGCDQRCGFCDAAATWHPGWKPANAERLTARQIAERVEEQAPEHAFVVLTGGEPTLYDLEPLVSELHRIGRRVHLETAGHREMNSRMRDALDWITLSPKGAGARPLEENVACAHEVKIIVENAETLRRDLNLVESLVAPGRSIWLHPEWSQSKNPTVLKLITETIKYFSSANHYPPRLRAGWQLHKLYNSDALDPNAKPPVPLGGEISQGASI